MNPEHPKDEGFAPASYTIRVDGTLHTLHNPEPTAADILKLAGKDPNDHVLILMIPGQEKRVLSPDDNIDLGQPGIEEFTFASTKRRFVVYVDETRAEFDKPEVTGLELLQVVGRQPCDFVVTQILPGVPDEFIEPGETVDLRRPGIEKFTTVILDEITILVNTRPKTVKARAQSFAQIVALAYGQPGGANMAYTISYRKGPHTNPAGTMVEGETVKIQEGMIFNVSATNRS